MGFNAPKVTFYAKFSSGFQMGTGPRCAPAPGSASYQFLIAGVPESLDYYVEAGGVRSTTYKLNVVRPAFGKEYQGHLPLPKWTDLRDAVGKSRRRSACRRRHQRGSGA
ncbi:MAG: hypothetical protein WDO73_15590 [Ignavibacteriota bacterium]